MEDLQVNNKFGFVDNGAYYKIRKIPFSEA